MIRHESEIALKSNSPVPPLQNTSSSRRWHVWIEKSFRKITWEMLLECFLTLKWGNIVWSFSKMYFIIKSELFCTQVTSCWTSISWEVFCKTLLYGFKPGMWKNTGTIDSTCWAEYILSVDQLQGPVEARDEWDPVTAASLVTGLQVWHWWHGCCRNGLKDSIPAGCWCRISWGSILRVRSPGLCLVCIFLFL